jgi:Flp pilus assembly pilin Flp
MSRTAYPAARGSAPIPEMKGGLVNVQAFAVWIQARISSGDRGAAVVEYGLLLALLVAVALVGVRVFGEGVSSQYSSIVSNVP